MSKAGGLASTQQHPGRLAVEQLSRPGQTRRLEGSETRSKESDCYSGGGKGLY